MAGTNGDMLHIDFGLWQGEGKGKKKASEIRAVKKMSGKESSCFYVVTRVFNVENESISVDALVGTLVVVLKSVCQL